jgi:protein gp37
MSSRIEWLKDPITGKPGYTINPVKGLCPVGCSYCYARRMYKRFKWNPEIRYDRPLMYIEPFNIKKPSKIFIGSTQNLKGHHSRVNRGSLVSAKTTSGTTVPYPEPRLDWDVIREAKLKCPECERFDILLGGCVYAWLPNQCGRT